MSIFSRKPVSAARPGSWLWPVPRRFVVLPACVVIALIIVHSTRASATMYFVSMPLVSGLPRSALAYVGPLIAATSAFIASSLLNPRNPMSSRSSRRFAGDLSRRVLTVLTVVFASSFLVAATSVTLWLSRHAASGSIDYVDIGLGVLQAGWCACVGVLLGRLAPQWLAPLLASVAVAAYALLMPAVVEPFLRPTSVSLGIEFLFPGTPAWQHEPFAPVTTAVLTAWWLLAIVATGWITMTVGRLQAGLRGGRGSIVLGIAAAVSFVLYVGAWQQPLVGELGQEAPVCLDETHLRTCVAIEEQPVLPAVREQAMRAYERLGIRPDGVQLVSVQASKRGSHDLDASLTVHIVPVTALGGASTVLEEVAGQLSGLTQCVQAHDDSVMWSLALAMWIAEDLDPELSRSGSRFFEPFGTATVEEVRAWYSANHEALAACAYDGMGPK